MKRKDGFTLLELIVAVTVLLVMTVLLGSVFRQATSAWDTGRVRGEGGMIARGVIGSVSRDLATAIDGRPYGHGWGLPKASGNTLEFVCLKEADSGGQEVHWIKYEVDAGSVTKTDQTWTGDGPGPVKKSSLFKSREGQKFTLEDTGDVFTEIPIPKELRERKYESGSPDAKSGYERYDVKAKWPTAPAAIKIRISFSQEGSFSGVSVRSLGRNGVPDDTEGTINDDIVIK